jgi:release factor H-coupled RctB family protein
MTPCNGIFSLIYVSCGEAYVGQTRSEATSTPPISQAPSEGTTSTEDSRGNESTGKDQPATVADGVGLESLQIEYEVSASIAILGKKSYIDPEAYVQLNRTAMLPGMRQVFGQPDLHPGRETDHSVPTIFCIH